MTTMALNRLNLWQKLGALVLAMLVPAVLVGFFYFTAMDGVLSQARDEVDGARYLAALGAIESSVRAHEGLAYVLANGDTTKSAAALSAQNDVTQAFQRAASVDAELGPRYGVNDDFNAAKSEWTALAAATAQQNAAQGAVAHNELMDHLRQLGASVSAASTIASDPD